MLSSFIFEGKTSFWGDSFTFNLLNHKNVQLKTSNLPRKIYHLPSQKFPGEGRVFYPPYPQKFCICMYVSLSGAAAKIAAVVSVAILKLIPALFVNGGRTYMHGVSQNA